MTRGMRLMIMVLILIGVVVGMMQCARKTLHKKTPQIQENGRAPISAIYLAGSAGLAIPADQACRSNPAGLAGMDS